MDPHPPDPHPRRLTPADLPPDGYNGPDELPTRPMPVVGAPPPPSSAGALSHNAPLPPANGDEPPSPYIPARPRPADGSAPRRPRLPPEQLAEVENMAPPFRDARLMHPAPQVTPATTRRGGPWGMIAGVLAGIVVLALGVMFALGGWYEGQYSGRIYPGVAVLGTDLGGLTPAEAHDALAARVDAFIKQPVILSWADKTWQPTPQQLGLAVNLDRTVDDAARVGRAGSFFTDWADRWNARQRGWTTQLVVVLDQATLQNYLVQEIAPQINQPLVEGEVWLQGEQIHTTEAKEGRELRIYDAVTTITGGVGNLATNNIPLPVAVTQPTVGAAEINEYNRLLQTWLSGPLTGNAAGQQLTLDRRQIAGLIALARNPDPAAPQHYDLHLRDDKLQEVADGWAGDINRAPQNARFDWNDGHVTVLQESQDGYELPISETVSVIASALSTLDKRTVDLPVKTLAPKVSSKDIDKLGIKEQIGHGNTTFQGSSEARATNIRTGAGYLNGQVVAPGDTFSILDAIAPIDLNRGYVEGYVIVAERTEKGVGGGTCQVSTTAFRAAFWAGLQITERNAHAYRVGVYEAKGEPVGFDAAVFDPGVDLKLVNNTPGYILFKTDTSNQELNVYIYGTPIADDVKLVGPNITNQQPPPQDIYQLDPTLPPGTKKQVETARGGLDVTLGRQVIKDGQVVSEDSFFSHFQAWPNWYLVAPDVPTPYPPRPPGP